MNPDKESVSQETSTEITAEEISGAQAKAVGTAVKTAGVSTKTVVIAASVAVVAVVITAAVIILNVLNKDDNTIGYASDAKVMLNQNDLQSAFDEALRNARDSYVALRYKNTAYSTDGTHFTCSIVNSAANLYDMFLTIYADEAMTDQLFLSGLVPPGSGFEELTLDHALPSGQNRVYVVVTQVDTNDDGEQVIKNQVVHTIEFYVE